MCTELGNERKNSTYRFMMILSDRHMSTERHISIKSSSNAIVYIQCTVQFAHTDGWKSQLFDVFNLVSAQMFKFQTIVTIIIQMVAQKSATY